MPASSQVSGLTAASSQVSRLTAAHAQIDRKAITEIGSEISPCCTAAWYVTRDEIEKNSPSRKDGMDSKTENFLRKSYCAFLKDLGIKLKMPLDAIATAAVYCHRFYLHQSHHKNDRYTVATACIFLAGKVEEARRPLDDVVLLSYNIQNKNNPVAAQEIKEKEVYERQKELVLLAEQVVLVTLDFNLEVHHPYKLLVTATSKYKSAPDALMRVARIIVNDGLHTSLCLQFKPEHIAAGALFLAAKLLKFKLPCSGKKGWWKEFGVTLRQLEDVSNQVLELYEQERVLSPLPQSSSSSSSADDGKAKPPSDAMAIAPFDSAKCPKGILQPHHNNHGVTHLNSADIITKKESQFDVPSSVGHPSSSLPTGPKLDSKDSVKSLQLVQLLKMRNPELKSSTFEATTKRKRIDEDGNLHCSNRPKPAVAVRRKDNSN